MANWPLFILILILTPATIQWTPMLPFDHGTPFYDAITHGCVDTEHSIQIGMRGLVPEKNDPRLCPLIRYGYAYRYSGS
ncbi:MAG: arginase family protein [Eubacterium sp.]